MPEKVRPQVESPRFPNPSKVARQTAEEIPRGGKLDRRGPPRYRGKRAPAKAEANRGGTTEDTNPSPSSAEGFFNSHLPPSPSPFPPPMMGGGKG
jgi:hypothetical protein